MKRKVLLIDLDPQGNTTAGSGVDKTQIVWAAQHVLLREVELSKATIKTNGGYDLLPTYHELIVAEVAGKVVGVLHMFERPALEKPCEAVVQALVVDNEARSSGVGEALMREAEAWAQSRKLSSVSLYSRVDRKPAHAFYERIGYYLKSTSVRMERGL